MLFTVHQSVPFSKVFSFLQQYFCASKSDKNYSKVHKSHLWQDMYLNPLVIIRQKLTTKYLAHVTTQQKQHKMVSLNAYVFRKQVMLFVFRLMLSSIVVLKNKNVTTNTKQTYGRTTAVQFSISADKIMNIIHSSLVSEGEMRMGYCNK